MKIPVFDGHNDSLTQTLETSRSFLTRSGQGHIDLPRAQDGGLAGGFFAIFTPPDPTVWGPLEKVMAKTDDGYEVIMPPACSQADAQKFTLEVMAHLFRTEAESKGKFKVARTIKDIEDCLTQKILAAVLHIEGVEIIDPDLDMLYVLHAAGLRSLGIVWSRPNIFGHGVPFKFPSSPDTGTGLTELGKRLVRACNRLGIMIDVSHLNEKGFWDVATCSDAPLVATHSAAHSLSQTARNLTDKQLAAIGETNGVIGVNFHVGDLRPDGQRNPDTPISLLVKHIDYIVKRIGIDHVAFGSDFDGATISNEIGDVTGLPKVIDALRQHGYSTDELEKIAYQNWLRVLKQTW